MNWLRKTFIALAGAASIALVISVATPRTARAVTAILVQMTNTLANPGVTQDITTMNAQNVELHCSNVVFLCYQVLADGSTSIAAYTTPFGSALVITSVDILPNPPGPQSFPVFASLWENASTGPNARETWVIQTDTSTLLQFPTSGIVLGSPTVQVAPVFKALFSNGSNTGLQSYTANLHGYLTSN